MNTEILEEKPGAVPGPSFLFLHPKASAIPRHSLRTITFKNGMGLKYNFPNSRQSAIAIVFCVGIKSVNLNKPLDEVLLTPSV